MLSGDQIGIFEIVDIEGRDGGSALLAQEVVDYLPIDIKNHCPARWYLILLIGDMAFKDVDASVDVSLPNTSEGRVPSSPLPNYNGASTTNVCTKPQTAVVAAATAQEGVLHVGSFQCPGISSNGKWVLRPNGQLCSWDSVSRSSNTEYGSSLSSKNGGAASADGVRSMADIGAHGREF
jgi:hypothetical protein